MKKYGILLTVLVLTAMLLTGCRRPDVKPTELPPTQGATIMPTTEATTMPTTVPTTVPTTIPTDPTDSAATENGANSGATDATTTDRSRMNNSK